MHTWTVNDPTEARNWLDAGVDGIITDNPGLVRQAILAMPRREEKQYQIVL